LTGSALIRNHRSATASEAESTVTMETVDDRLNDAAKLSTAYVDDTSE